MSRSFLYYVPRRPCVPHKISCKTLQTPKSRELIHRVFWLCSDGFEQQLAWRRGDVSDVDMDFAAAAPGRVAVEPEDVVVPVGGHWHRLAPIFAVFIPSAPGVFFTGSHPVPNAPFLSPFRHT